MNDLEERVLDIALEELLGRSRPPDIAGKIAEALILREPGGAVAAPSSPTVRRTNRFWGITAMAASLALCSAVLWIIISSPFGTAEPPPNGTGGQDSVEAPADYGKWIERLGSEDPETRTAAAEALVNLGESALPRLRKSVAEASSAEVRARLEDIIRRLEPSLFKTLDGFLEKERKAGTFVIALDEVDRKAVQALLPTVRVFRVWRQGSKECWKTVGFDRASGKLFEISAADDWEPYAGDLKPAQRKELERLTEEWTRTVHESLAAYTPGTPLFRKIGKADGVSGDPFYVMVGADGITMIADRLQGDREPLWRANLKPFAGGIGTSVIRHMVVEKGEAMVVIGKHSYASVNLSTGKVTDMGSD